MAEELFKYIYEKLDHEIMLLRVDKTYRSYGINCSMASVVNAIDISNITNDRGDTCEEMAYAIEYNYAGESEEPAPPKIDKMAPVTALSDK